MFRYMECVDRFAFSLAGYCIATYVLGIKDRHQDNIMLAKDGRVYKILKNYELSLDLSYRFWSYSWAYKEKIRDKPRANGFYFNGSFSLCCFQR